MKYCKKGRQIELEQTEQRRTTNSQSTGTGRA